jgi:hypothetical protein
MQGIKLGQAGRLGKVILDLDLSGSVSAFQRTIPVTSGLWCVFSSANECLIRRDSPKFAPWHRKGTTYPRASPSPTLVTGTLEHGPFSLHHRSFIGTSAVRLTTQGYLELRSQGVFPVPHAFCITTFHILHSFFAVQLSHHSNIPLWLRKPQLRP